MKKTDVTYRKVAIMLAKSLPVEQEAFTTKVNEYLAVIQKMPKASKVALRSAYIFSAKVPREERQDLFQDLALTLLKAKQSSEKLAYAIARCDWKDWWKAYKIRQHFSLDSVIEDTDGNETTLAELLVGEVDFEAKMCDKIDCQSIWRQLPANIQKIVTNRLIGNSTPVNDRQTLNRWVKATGYSLLLQS